MTSRTTILVQDVASVTFLEERYMEPLWHLEDRGDHFLVGADLPYVSKEDLQVTCWQRSLEIKTGIKKDPSGGQWSFRAVITFPCDIASEGISARFIKQILEVRIPKDIKERRNVKID